MFTGRRPARYDYEYGRVLKRKGLVISLQYAGDQVFDVTKFVKNDGTESVQPIAPDERRCNTKHFFMTCAINDGKVNIDHDTLDVARSLQHSGQLMIVVMVIINTLNPIAGYAEITTSLRIELLFKIIAGIAMTLFAKSDSNFITAW